MTSPVAVEVSGKYTCDYFPEQKRVMVGSFEGVVWLTIADLEKMLRAATGNGA